MSGTTISDLGERALRRIGVAIVPFADRPPLNAMVTPASVATAALFELGVIASFDSPPLIVAVTPDSVATAALVELGVIAADEIPAPADQALAMAKVAAVQASLAAQTLVSWDPTIIPTAAVEEYTKMTASMMASSFGKSADLQIYAELEARVRHVSLVFAAPEIATKAVQAVQDSLTAQALVWWDNTGIPSAVAEEYTKLAALQMAPTFGKAADPQLYAALEARVRHVALVLSAPDLATAAVQAVHDDLTARGRVRWSVFDIPPAAVDPYVALAAAALAPRFEQQFPPDAVIAATRSLAQIIALPTSGERVQAEYF